MEIKVDDINKLILQFLKEQGYQKSYEQLQLECGTNLNLCESKDKIKQDILDGKWDIVLKQIKTWKLESNTLIELYELIIDELMEINEVVVAEKLFKTIKLDQVERLLKIDYLIKNPHTLKKFDKYERRQIVSNMILKEAIVAQPSKLIELIGDGLKFRAENKLISIQRTFDIFNNISVKQSGILQRIDKVIKYAENMRVNQAIFSNEALITGSIDGIIEVWDPQSYTIKKDLDYQARDEYMFHQSSIIDFSVIEELLASLDQQGIVKIWKLKTGKCLRKIDSTHQKPITSIQFGQDPSLLFIASNEIQLNGLRVKNSNPILKVFRGHEANINSMLVSSEGSRLYSGSLDCTVRIWDTTTQEQIFIFKCQGSVEKLIFNNKKEILICQRDFSLILLSQSLNEIKRYSIDQKTEFTSANLQNDNIYGITQNMLYIFDKNKAVKLPGGQALGCELYEDILFIFTNTGELIFIRP